MPDDKAEICGLHCKKCCQVFPYENIDSQSIFLTCVKCQTELESVYKISMRIGEIPDAKQMWNQKHIWIHLISTKGTAADFFPGIYPCDFSQDDSQEWSQLKQYFNLLEKDGIILDFLLRVRNMKTLRNESAENLQYTNEDLWLQIEQGCKLNLS